MVRKNKKKNNRTKVCPSCKGTHICRPCKGTGMVKIVNGRSKGGTFERKIAKMFSEWVGTTFARTPGSGSWNQTGDITPKDPKQMVDFPFSIECKNNETFSIQALIIGCSAGKVMKYFKDCWAQCLSDSKKSKKIPLLIMTSANQPIFAIMHRKHFKRIGLHKTSCHRFYFKTGYAKLYMVLLSDLLLFDYEIVKKAVRNGKA